MVFSPARHDLGTVDWTLWYSCPGWEFNEQRDSLVAQPTVGGRTDSLSGRPLISQLVDIESIRGLELSWAPLGRALADRDV